MRYKVNLFVCCLFMVFGLHAAPQMDDLVSLQATALEKLNLGGEADSELKGMLTKWVLHEMLEKQEIEKAKRLRQQRQKWIIAGVGVVTTVVPLVTALVEMANGCADEPGATEFSSSLNITF